MGCYPAPVRSSPSGPRTGRGFFREQLWASLTPAGGVRDQPRRIISGRNFVVGRRPVAMAFRRMISVRPALGLLGVLKSLVNERPGAPGHERTVKKLTSDRSADADRHVDAVPRGAGARRSPCRVHLVAGITRSTGKRSYFDFIEVS
jgi:hypothetical protein